METSEFWKDFDYWRSYLTEIYTQIKSGMAEEDESFVSRKGIIVEKGTDTEARLDFVKDYLHVSELKKDGKVSELKIDSSWKAIISNTHECWNRFVAAAYKANDGLLILNISDRKMFEPLLWHIRQVAKQETELTADPSLDKKSRFFDMRQLERDIEHLRMIGRDVQEIEEFIKKSVSKAKELRLIPSMFEFKGYVLIVLDGFAWDEIRKEAKEKHLRDFQSTMQFYKVINF